LPLWRALSIKNSLDGVSGAGSGHGVGGGGVGEGDGEGDGEGEGDGVGVGSDCSPKRSVLTIGKKSAFSAFCADTGRAMPAVTTVTSAANMLATRKFLAERNLPVQLRFIVDPIR
jgi:hypothetical protein